MLSKVVVRNRNGAGRRAVKGVTGKQLADMVWALRDKQPKVYAAFRVLISAMVEKSSTKS